MEEIIDIIKEFTKKRHSNRSEGQKRRRLNDMMVALEFGFKQYEQGNNLQKAKENFIEVYNGKNGRKNKH